jgi:putative ABC transport system permease protein
MEEELAFHREMRRRSLSRIDPANADAEAVRRMGSVLAAKDGMRDARGVPWLASAVQDLRHGFVVLQRDAVISALVILVLALGIGGNAAIFTLLKSAFLDPLPYAESGRLVMLYDRFSGLGFDQTGPTIPEFVDVRDRARSFEQLAFLDHRDFQLTGADEPVRVFAARVTASFFPVLGISAAMGRTFMPKENLGRGSVVIVSDSFWRSRLGGDKGVIGRLLRLNGDPCKIVGVLPPGLSFDYPTLGVPEPADIYVPFEMSDAYMLRSSPYGNIRRVLAVGRLRATHSVAEASAEVETIAAQLASEHAALYRGPNGEHLGFGMGAMPLREAIVARHRLLLWLLAASVGILLLSACANTAQLLLARSLQRAREVAIRTALGASRARLAQQFLLEGVTLAACGGAAGLVLAGWLAHLLPGLLPVRSPVFASARLDAGVIAFTVAITLISCVAFAILPAVKGSAWCPGPMLSVRHSVGQGTRWRQGMLALEAALSVFLLCGAGLVAQNLLSLEKTPAGFDARQVYVMQLRMPYRREQALNPRPMMGYREYLDRVAAVPGVESAAMVTGLPLRGAEEIGFNLEGAAAATPQRALFQAVSTDYFRTLRIPLIAGRPFRDDDRTDRPRVAIVNREFVRRFGGGADAIGRRVVLDRPATIVGVVGDVRMRPLATAPEPQIYLSYLQFYEPNQHLVVRSALSEGEVVSRVTEAIRGAYADQAIFHPMTMENVFARSVAEPRFQAWLVGAFALLALAIATSGMYSVVACLVMQRTSEIALRMALGADRLAIVRTMLGATASWVGAGLAVGFGLVIAASGAVRKLSNSASGARPEMYAAVAGLFLAVTIVASYLPVRRASAVDPAEALRAE